MTLQMNRRFQLIGRHVVEADTARQAAERLFRKTIEPEGAANWGVWCEVSGGITGHRQAWLKSTRPSKKHPQGIVARLTEAAARAKADELNRTMSRNTKARFSYTAKELPK